MSAIKIMLVDDHELVRQGLRTILELEDDILVVNEFDNGRVFLEKLGLGMIHPDIVVMDIEMPYMSGIETTQRLKEMAPRIQVIALSAVDKDSTIAQMLMAGACGYVIKSSAASDLVHAIRAAHAGESAVNEEIRKRVNRFKERRNEQKKGGLLTKREIEVMGILVQGYSNKEIARRMIVSERTVQTHLRNIFAKMNVTSRTEAVLIAIRDGWISMN